MTPLEGLLREALAEFAARVEPRPALHLIRMRTALAERAWPTRASDPNDREGNRSMTTIAAPRRRLPLPERFMSYVKPASSGCWAWAGRTDKDGYGLFHIDGRPVLAHRASYLLLVGAIPEGLQLDHLCHTGDLSCAGGIECPHRSCVNPAHLEPVTPAENRRRSERNRSALLEVAALNRAKTHCPKGHEYAPANTYVCAGRRTCRICQRHAVAAYKARKAEATR